MKGHPYLSAAAVAFVLNAVVVWALAKATNVSDDDDRGTILLCLIASCLFTGLAMLAMYFGIEMAR